MTLATSEVMTVNAVGRETRVLSMHIADEAGFILHTEIYIYIYTQLCCSVSILDRDEALV
jgi:hypothetical protein